MWAVDRVLVCDLRGLLHLGRGTPRCTDLIYRIGLVPRILTSLLLKMSSKIISVPGQRFGNCAGQRSGCPWIPTFNVSKVGELDLQPDNHGNERGHGNDHGHGELQRGHTAAAAVVPEEHRLRRPIAYTVGKVPVLTPTVYLIHILYSIFWTSQSTRTTNNVLFRWVLLY